MKKLLVITTILFAGVFVFTSCDKTEDVEPGSNPSAVIRGNVYADLDLSNSEAEKAPEGTEIFFRINSEDLVLSPLANYAYQTLQYKTTVDSDGTYSITLPSAKHQAVAVVIQGNEFMTSQVQSDSEVENAVFFVSPLTVATEAGQTYYVNIAYTNSYSY